MLNEMQGQKAPCNETRALFCERKAHRFRDKNAMNSPETQSRHSVQRFDMLRVVLDYEIRSSWWAAWIGNDRLRNLAASYFAWKVRRKFARWEQSCRDAERLKAHIAEVSASAQENQ